MTLSRSTLCQEITEIVIKHLNELSQYSPVPMHPDDTIPEDIVICLERLSEICQYSPNKTSYEIYVEACARHDELENFLDSMNHVRDCSFEETHIGQIWLRVCLWLQVAAEQFQPVKSEVWDFIAPVLPDRLVNLGSGQYEARWWKPVPMMDVEILRGTAGILVHGDPFEPSNLAGGLACRFSVSTCG
ncbi:MAG: hypothetical protein ABI690_19805 [Chloroflexota bacterium]